MLLRGLLSFPAEPGMLCMLLDAEQFSTSQQRVVHHLSEVRLMRVEVGVGRVKQAWCGVANLYEVGVYICQQ